MWSQTLNLGLGLNLTLSQLVVLAAFFGLVLGYFLAWMVNRGKKPAPAAALVKERAAGNAAFMKGINYILSGNHDKAIEELTRAVSVDTDTVETYVALGNLFRRTGEIDRAIRIRQSVIVRPNIDPKTRLQAMLDLGRDFRRAGLYERAVKTFEDVIAADPKREEAYLELIQVFEETRDWDKAFALSEKLARLTGRREINVLAHYLVETGKAHFEKGQVSQAKAAYKKAYGLDPKCLDAYLHLGDLLLQEGKHKKAVAVWRKAATAVPEMAFLTFGRLGRVAAVMKDTRSVESFLNEVATADGNPLAHLAHLTLARLLADRGRSDQAILACRQALAMDAGFIDAHRELGLLLVSLSRDEDALSAYRLLLANLEGPEASFQCTRCGFESHELMWRCPQCNGWDLMNLRRNLPKLFQPTQPILLPEPVLGKESAPAAGDEGPEAPTR